MAKLNRLARTDGRPRWPPSRKGVREAMASPDDLPLAGLPSELTDDLDGLGDPGRADRLAAGLQAARGVHGDLAVQRGEPLGGRGSALALFDEPQVLDREDLGDREIVMDFRDLNVLGHDLGLVEGALPRDHRRVERRKIAPVMEGEEVARLAGPGDPDR